MIKPKILIVGTGLGGCSLAQALTPWAEVTMVELSPAQMAATPPLQERGRPANVAPLRGLGLGGTTQLWHNGLIQLPTTAFTQWPYPAEILKPWQEAAYGLLSPTTAINIHQACQILAARYGDLGLASQNLGNPIYYPQRRRNLWRHLGLEHRVRLVRGQALACTETAMGRRPTLTLETAPGITQTLTADALILAAGGLVTPVLLQAIAPYAGRGYEDHATAFVGEVTLNPAFAKLWNFQPTGLGGSLRLPMVVPSPLGPVAFYLRPAYHAPLGRAGQQRQQLTSTLAQLRNQPFNPRLLWQLLQRADDMAEILSLKLGVNLPTSCFSVMMIASQPGQTAVGVGGTLAQLWRHWALDAADLAQLERTINTAMEWLSPLSQQQSIYPDWTKTLTSSAHHSGTARMAHSPAEGVCDANGQVFHSQALYVADASAIPNSGYANTGLTIAALSLKLAEHLKERFCA
jgi:2-polyprenyl-6-methoxyphenol hydroxylase-like FAD-dependent oxidoreductase